jgi:hypothetical protein
LEVFPARISLTWAFQSVFVEEIETAGSLSIDGSIDTCSFLFSPRLAVFALLDEIVPKKLGDDKVLDEAALDTFRVIDFESAVCIRLMSGT